MAVTENWDGTHPVAERVIALQPPMQDAVARMTVAKRAFDIFFSLFLLIPLSIVMLGVAGVLLLSQGRPILYVAPRMKTAEDSFHLLKFRTMHRVDEDSGATGAHKSWRITSVGRILRRTRIDELPQLFNILRGDMSFVGPRPPLREYVERFPREYGQVLRMRPGVTGLATLIYHAQEDRIMASCDTAEATEAAYYRRCLPTKLQLDMIYQRRRNMALDFWIIWNTSMTVIIPGWKPKRLAERAATQGQAGPAARSETQHGR